MESKIFREYDIRGEYPTQVNEEAAYLIGLGYGSYIKEKFNQNTCVISRDVRLSGESLTNSLVKGLLETGCNVIDYGITTTPMNFYARHINNLFGIMVTASHNPKDDNGFKFSFGGPNNACGEEIKDLLKYIEAKNFQKGEGKYETKSIENEYIKYIESGLNIGNRKIKVVVDCGNGATSIITRKVFEKFNLDLIIINEEPDGRFPNHHPDPAVKENLIQLKEAVLNNNADLGIAYDGDGDRIGFVKNDGSFMTTEEYMILITRNLINNIENKTILYDVKCSKALEDEINKLGGTPLLYRTGASYTQKKVHEAKIAFGGEFSGHVFFTDRVFDVGSALYASLRLVEILSHSDKNITDLLDNINKYYATEEIKITTTEEIKFNVVNKVKKHCQEKNYPFNDIDGVKVFFDEGWALIRASNTGPNLIFRAEASTEEGKNKLQDYFLKLIEHYNK